MKRSDTVYAKENGIKVFDFAGIVDTLFWVLWIFVAIILIVVNF